MFTQETLAKDTFVLTKASLMFKNIEGAGTFTDVVG